MRIVALVLALLLSSCVTDGIKEATPEQIAALIAATQKHIEPRVDFDPDTKFRVAALKFDFDVDAASRQVVETFLDSAPVNKVDIAVIEINTLGGSVDEGKRIALAIENSKMPVVCVVEGNAFSMGSYILQACSKRFMTRRSIIMLHGPSTVYDERSNVAEFQSIVDRLLAMEKAKAIHECKRMKLEFGDCFAHFKGGREWWVMADEALMVGMVDDIVESVPELLRRLRADGL